MHRSGDGSAGDVNYQAFGGSYMEFRHPDPRIAELLHAQLGNAGTVLNVGAGTGSYEPEACVVTALEPSASMRAKRAPHLPQAVDATAEKMPFPNGSFDASMSTFSVHQ